MRPLIVALSGLVLLMNACAGEPKELRTDATCEEASRCGLDVRRWSGASELPAKGRHLAKILREAREELQSMFRPDTAFEEEKLVLVPVRGDGDAADTLLVMNEEKTVLNSVVIGEFSITVKFTPKKPREIDTKEAAADAYREWVSSTVKAGNNVKDLALSVTDRKTCWVVRRELFAADGKTPRPAWSWPESIRMVIKKADGEAFVGIQRLPGAVTSMPAGRAMRAKGHWFDDVKGAEGRNFKKAPSPEEIRATVGTQDKVNGSEAEEPAKNDAADGGK